MNFLQLCLIGAGGAAGAIARVSIAQLLKSPPWDILIVNFLGSMLIGLVMAWPGDTLRPEFRQIIAAGFCGGFTTFSTFSLQTLELFSKGKISIATSNIALSMALCLFGCWIGLQIAQR